MDNKLIARLAKVSRGDINPVTAFFGGVLAQEVIKASSGKYMPIRQWMFFDAREVLPADEEVVAADYDRDQYRLDTLKNMFRRQDLCGIDYLRVSCV